MAATWHALCLRGVFYGAPEVDGTLTVRFFLNYHSFFSLKKPVHRMDTRVLEKKKTGGPSYLRLVHHVAVGRVSGQVELLGSTATS